MIVYLLLNTANGKGYVGQTTLTVKRRWKIHLKRMRAGSHLPIHSAIRKYGQEAFEHSILAEVSTLDELNALEEFHIKVQGTLVPNGYNLLPGGKGRGAVHPDTRKKMSDAQKGKKRSLEAIAKTAAGNRGKKRAPYHYTLESKSRMVSSHLGRKASDATRAKMRASSCHSPKGGLKGGLARGRMAVESGQIFRITSLGGTVGCCLRWNINRGKPCTCGRHLPIAA